MYLTNFIFKCFFSYRFLPNFKKWCDSDNHGSFFQGTNSLQLDSFQFLKINSFY